MRGYKYGKILLLLLILPSFVFAKGRDGLSDFQKGMDSLIKMINCDLSVQVVSGTKYDLLYEYQPSKKMIPASITKVITSAIALEYLGAGYEFKTILYTDDTDLSDGVVNGNIYIKGFGDPDFKSADLVKMVRIFASKNITEITGNIVYDDSFLDNKHFGLADYYSGDTKLQYWPYVNALSFDRNASRLDAAVEAANFLKSELELKKVKLDGIIVAGVTPDKPREITRATHTIDEVLASMNKPSDNHSAITIFKVVGAVYMGAPGTLEKGTAAVIDLMSSLGIARSEYEILEGSGLTRYNYVTSNVYIQLLKYLFDQEKSFSVFYQSLPVAGVDGTLKKRMTGTEAEKNVHAKTGSINGVSTLTGYAISRDNEPLIFYIAMNGFKGANWEQYRNYQDAICSLLCRFSRN
ncbi:MAG: D-alanyl-D-alanine carboxypeptidase/D-alanyl-D-alanine-endopeptidase [Bacteroidetes bacterium]|nr:D-alanyl-D-alanine carboxypeptidase/D-alanyl-D-alanine-endopeptidase [Bacteroidota bacterium]